MRREAIDVVEQILGDLRQESCVFCRLVATEPWRIQKGDSPVAPFYAVLSGRVRLRTGDKTYDLAEGDFLVLPGGKAHELAGQESADTDAIPLLALFADAGIEPWQPGMRFRAVHLTYGGGGPESVLLVGLFFFGDPRTNPLLAALPPVLVVRGGPSPDSGSSRTALDAMAQELANEQPASNLIIAKLADLLFVQALRAYLSTDLRDATGWMRGITDPLVGRAISLMHAAPEHSWTLQKLAAEIGTSRAVLAQRFSTLVGQGALTYLTQWRMHLAASLLLNDTGNIRSIAHRVGYQSEAAFSKTFRRWAGVPPSQYRAKMLQDSKFASAAKETLST